MSRADYGFVLYRSHMKDMLRGELLATGLEMSPQQRRGGLGGGERGSRHHKRPGEALLTAELRKNADVIRQKHNNTYYGIINGQCVLPGM